MVQLSIKKYIDKYIKGQIFALLFPLLSFAQFSSSKDCNTAYRICDATASYHFIADTNPGVVDDSYLYDSGFGIYSTIYCIGGSIYPTPEWHPAWFTFTAQYSGQFGFLICPDNSTIDWQWALFENPVCGNLSDTSHHLRCNTQSPAPVADGCTGIGFRGIFGGGGY